MTDARLTLRQVRFEQKQFFRNPASAFFAMVFPVMFLVIFGSINRSSTIATLQGIAFNQFYVPAIIAFGVIGATYTNLAIAISIRRDLGVLKRLRATPLPAWVFISGVIGNAIVVSLILTVLTTVIGALFYGVSVPARELGLAIDVMAGALVFCALGLALATVIPNGDAAPAVTNFTLLPVVFISGTFGYIDPSSTISKIADLFPVKHFNQTVFAAFDPHGSGIGVSWRDLAVMGIWGVFGVVVALRNFRWEPRRG